MTDTPAERGDISIWADLRRRRVAQWALAYAAGAWVLLQVLGFVSDSFAWPATVKQIATIILAVGLPIVVVLGWYHGERGQRRVSGPELAVLTLLLLIGGGLLWLYSQRSVPTTTTATAETPAPVSAAVDGRPSIAVLPFDNRSRLEDDAFFVDGIHDDILTQLSKVSALRVISRTSVERFRKSELSIQDIAQQLGVRSILEGGVQRAGDRVRVTVQLIDASTDAHLWAENYDRELSAANIFAIQSELAAAIAGALKASLTPGEQARARVVPTQNLEAWEAYQRAKQRMASRVSSELTDAERYFRQSIALDPKFALAWVGLADTFLLQINYSERPKEAALTEAETAIDRALELDPNLAEAQTSSAGIAQNRGQTERAVQLLRRAIGLNPNYATAHQWLSESLVELDLREEALLEAERARVLDPMSPVIAIQVGVARMAVGRFDDALIAIERAADIEPTMAISYASIGDIHAYAFGQLEKAPPFYKKAVQLDPGNANYMASLAEVYWELGDEVESEKWVSRALAIGEENAYANAVAAILYLNRGDMESARRRAQKAGELEPSLLFLIRDHDLLAGEYTTARTRYARAFPRLFSKELPKLTNSEAFAAVEVALVLQHTSESERAKALLDRSDTYMRTIPRMGILGYGYADARIHALRGEKKQALAALLEAEQAGCCQIWRYYRDFDPALASIRNDPEFKAIFADIERDMAQQRARLAARPKDAPLELTDASR